MFRRSGQRFAHKDMRDPDSENCPLCANEILTIPPLGARRLGGANRSPTHSP